MAKLIHCDWEVSGSIPDRTLTQGLKIIGEKLHNDPRAVFCAMGHIS